jgi:hypothetical protein
MGFSPEFWTECHSAVMFIVAVVVFKLEHMFPALGNTAWLVFDCLHLSSY